jgi:type VI secretion system protein ImpL
MWIWLLAITLTVGIWVAGHFLEAPLWLEVVPTVVIAAGLVAWIVGRRVRAALKARSLERELLRQAEQQAMNARPDRRAEILELHAQMQKGLQALRNSRLASRGGGALYTLPWYMIIGPPGAGKTTALKHSGLVFPFQGPGVGGGVRGVGGTRNCDWWFTNEAILLDTAGRWTTEADDRDEWLAFLDTLRKYRSQKPINGVLVAISITDLMQATEEQLDSYAKRLRARFDEMTTRLQMIVPAYVIFTKADLVAGFVEFWGELSKAERQQIWGMTFPLANSEGRDTGQAFDEEFDGVVSCLHARALRRVGAARQPETRQRICQFPLEFAALKPNLRTFVSALMQPNAFQETPILRGVYFSSGTQEGRPIDRVIDGMRRAFNLGPAGGGGGVQVPQTEAKSYFVTDVFQKVVFPDQAVASRTRQELRRQSLRRAAIGLTAGLLAAMVIVPCVYTFTQNLAYVSESREMAERSQSIDWADSSPFVAKVHKLDDLRARLDELSRWRKERVPLRMGWGMYAGDGLYTALRAVYVSSLQAQFAEPSRIELERELAATAASPTRLTVDQYHVCFDRLRAYLEMSDAARIEQDWESSSLTDVWARLLGTVAEKSALAPHAEQYVGLVQSGEAAPWHVDPNLVNRVQALLKQVPDVELDYGAILHDANDNAEPIKRQSIFIGSKFQTFLMSKAKPEVVVPGAFTRAAWEAIVRNRLDKSRAKHLAEGRWVLGDTQELGVEHAEALLQDLRSRYFVDYKNAWAAFLNDFDLRRPVNGAEALDELTSLTENPPPYAKLLAVLADNTRLELPPPTVVQKASGQVLDRVLDQARGISGDSGVVPEKEKPWVSPVQADFQPLVAFGVAPDAGGDTQTPTGLSHYLQQILAKVLGALQDLKDAQAAPDPAALDQTFREALRGTSELVSETQSGFTSPILAPLLMNPLHYGYDYVLTPLAGEVDRKWGLDVWQAWHDKLDAHYPFADTGRDATLADYAEFFKPDKGLLWTFYNENLHATLERDGDAFVPVPQAKWAKYTPVLLRCYTRGWQMTSQTFPEGAEMPLVEFDANVHSVSDTVSAVTFEVDGASGTYKNTPEEWFHVQWPSKDPKKRGASLRVRGYDSLDELLARPGDFGLFRLLDSASAIEPGSGGKTIVAKWNLQSQNAWVRMDIRPTRAQSVFTSYLEKHERMFKNYQCPNHLAGGP